jgi:hypothetical protein
MSCSGAAEVHLRGIAVDVVQEEKSFPYRKKSIATRFAYAILRVIRYRCTIREYG